MFTRSLKRTAATAAVFFLTVLTVPPTSADPCDSYEWGSYTIAPHSTDTFTVEYNGGEWADAKAIPDYESDDIDMKVYDTLGFLEASDTTHVSPHCHWWVGYLFTSLTFKIKVINNGSHSIHYQFRPY